MSEETNLNVYGRGVCSTKPDYFSIRFEVGFRDPDDDYCYEIVAEKAERLLKALKKWAGADDLVRTTSFSFYHSTLSEKEGGWPKGTVLAYVSTTIHVESGRIDDIAALISLARKNGATDISDVAFSLSDSLRQAEREKALTLAAEAAMRDAEVTAKAFGVAVLGLSSVNIENGFTHDDYSDRYCIDSENACRSLDDYGRGRDVAPEFISAGEIRTAVSIDAVFRLSR